MSRTAQRREESADAPATHRCGICGFVAKNAGGLGTHRRAMHGVGKLGPNATAIEAVLAAAECDAATAQMARSIAANLDAEPSNAQMWRTYREIVKELTLEDEATDETDDELAEIRGTAPLGHLTAVR